MKCGCYLLQGDNPVAGIVIDNQIAYIRDGDEKENLPVSPKECFNTLISLYSLKEKWVIEECERPVLQVAFDEAGKTEIYKFNLNNLPDNWSMFIAYLNRIMGKYVW